MTRMQDMPTCIQAIYTQKQFVILEIGDKHCNVMYNDNIFIFIKEVGGFSTYKITRMSL
jgi:hypothetical protein